MENVFYLNENLQLVDYKCDAVAIAYFFKDECTDSLYQLGDERFNKIVEITFLKPIGHNATLNESRALQQTWKKKNYPQYNSFLPSEKICSLIRAVVNQNFNNCWTRSYEDVGYPVYRYYPIVLKDGRFFLGDNSTIAENVYVSLVLTKFEFLKLNPKLQLED